MRSITADFGEFRAALHKGPVTQKVYNHLYILCDFLDAKYVEEVIVPYCQPFMKGKQLTLKVGSAQTNPFAVFATNLIFENISEDDFKTLCQCRHFQGAKTLVLKEIKGASPLLEILANATAFPRVNDLTLAKGFGQHTSTEGWLEMLKSAWVGKLTELHLVDIRQPVTAPLDVLITAPQFEQMTLLNCNLGPLDFLEDLDDKMWERVSNYN